MWAGHTYLYDSIDTSYKPSSPVWFCCTFGVGKHVANVCLLNRRIFHDNDCATKQTQQQCIHAQFIERCVFFVCSILISIPFQCIDHNTNDFFISLEKKQGQIYDTAFGIFYSMHGKKREACVSF